jgi:outer membrane phospholipase A
MALADYADFKILHSASLHSEWQNPDFFSNFEPSLWYGLSIEFSDKQIVSFQKIRYGIKPKTV